MLAQILSFFTGGVLKELRGAYQDRLKATTAREKLDADERIKVLENAASIAQIEASDPVSATRIGRLLIVVPFGLWWAAIFIDSIFSFTWDVLAVPPNIMAMANILVPAIIIADAGALTLRRTKRN